MKTIFLNFFVLVAFILSAVQCKVNAGDFNSCAGCSTGFDFHVYTAEEQQQVLRNLVGRYRNTSNNQVTTLDIRAIPEVTQIGIVDYSVRDQERVSYPYTVIFDRINAPILFFIRSGVEFRFRIEFDPNDLTRVTGLRNQEESGSILYFERLLFTLSAEEQQRVRQSLPGIYRNSVLDSETIMLDIEAIPADRRFMGRLHYIINNGERVSQNYTIVFFGDRPPVLSLIISGASFQFDIEFDANDRTQVIRLRNQVQTESISFFYRSVPSLSIEEQQQVRQNLAGTYQNSLNNERITIESISDRNQMSSILYYIGNNGERTSYPYTVLFSANRPPMLFFTRSGISFRFNIEFDPNDHTQIIGLRNESESEQVSYFYRLNNNEVFPHDEL